MLVFLDSVGLWLDCKGVELFVGLSFCVCCLFFYFFFSMTARFAIRKSDKGGTIEFLNLCSVLLCPQYKKKTEYIVIKSQVSF